MFASRRNAIDDQVHERFIRVVGRPENADPPPARVVALPEPSAPVVALPDPDNDAGPVSRAGPGSGVGPTSGVGPGSGGPGDAVGPAPAGAAAARPAPVAERALPGLRGALLTLDPGHRGVRALALVAVVAVAAAAFFAWRSRPEVEPVAAVRAEAASADASSPSPAGTVVVAVTGKVVHPGLVRLPSGSRVADAIEAAGGVQPGTDLSFVNLARKVVDGELIAVGITAPPGTALDGATSTPAGRARRRWPAQPQPRHRGAVRVAARHRSGTRPAHRRLPHRPRPVPLGRRAEAGQRPGRESVRPDQSAGDGISGARAGGPDLRLAGVATGVWLAALAGLHESWRTGVLVAATAAVSALAAAVPRGRRGPVRWIVAGVLVGVAAGAGATAARVALRDAPPLAGLAADRADVTADLTATDDPHPTRTVAGRPAQYAVGATLTRLRTGDQELRLSARVLVLGADPAWRRVLPGQRVAVEGRLAAARGGDLQFGVADGCGYAPADRPAAVAAAGRGTPAQRPPARLLGLPAEAGGLLPRLVDGDTSRLEPAVDADFQTTGMTHLVAVSGENVAIILGFALGLARWCRAGPRVAAAACAVALVGFVILVRPSPSVLRAEAAMGGLALVGLASGRPRSAVPALAAVAALLILVDPELAGAAGFALSVLATAGLLLVAPGWAERLRRRGCPGARRGGGGTGSGPAHLRPGDRRDLRRSGWSRYPPTCSRYRLCRPPRCSGWPPR